MTEVKFTFTVDQKTANRIDRYRHERRIDSKSEALRLLIKQGLSELETHNTPDGPTQKQIELVKKLCKERNIAPPDEFTLKAYQAFIARYIRK